MKILVDLYSPDIRRVKCPKCGAPKSEKCATTMADDAQLVTMFSLGASRNLHWACIERAAASMDETPGTDGKQSRIDEQDARRRRE